MSQMLKGHARQQKGAFYPPENQALASPYDAREGALAHQEHRDIGEMNDLGRDGTEQEPGAGIEPPR